MEKCTSLYNNHLVMLQIGSNNMDIGTTIKKLRQKSGITQQHLAEYLNVSMQTVSRWETSVTYPDVVMLPVLAKHFHVTVDYLLGIGRSTMKAIESKRLLIREWNENDAADLLALKQDSKDIISYIKINSINESLDTIKIWKEYQEMYPVFFKETGKLIGITGLVDIDRYKGYREIEVHICDKYNDVDHVKEAHKLILDYGFNEHDLLVAFAYCGSSDEILIQSMIETGFIYEGTLRKFGRDMSDRLRYSILKEEFIK